jgi:alkanesulfonate monooxygenase SsuD/methylene tetrahydromethanopterin reductase-like flavin-dependent oxidoreductase (luciferase family)
VTFDGEFDRVAHAGINPRPIQRPIPLWFGGGANAVLERAARFGAGWIPLGEPDDQVAGQITDLQERLRRHGRRFADFGIEGWIRSGGKPPEHWAETLDRWRRLGATHGTFYTSGQGVGGPDEQIAAMRSFLEQTR